MAADEGRDEMAYKVVVNDDEQFSIWPAERANPPGWTDAGSVGTRDECLTYIRGVWTDMRPARVRRRDAGAPRG